MEDIVIRRPKLEDRALLYAFCETVLIHTFEINGLSEFNELLIEEIEDKKKCINEDFETKGNSRYFLIAEYKGELIGTIEYGIANELLNRCTNDKLKDLLEIGTVFVHPNFQRKGISSLLLNAIFQVLKEKNVTEICFDSGYRIAQKIWSKKYGEPEYFLKDYWGKDSHHMVWRVKVN
jgi:GNAT superfamily N-acetyltransferase